VYEKDLKIDAYMATKNIPEYCTPIPLTMPEQYHEPDAVNAYRSYYLKDKGYLEDKNVTLSYLTTIWK
jgi:hypothetical protein